MTGAFPSVLKTVKVFSVFDKNSNLDIGNYCPIFLYSNLEKTLENIMLESETLRLMKTFHFHKLKH